MEKLELVKRAYEANAFTTDDTAAGYVNPEYWDKQLFDHIRANLVMLPLGKDVTARFPKDGDTFNLTIRAEPAMASAVAESAALSVVAHAPTQAVLTPSEYGLAYQISDKELRRAFYPVMDAMVQDIGYGISKAIDEAILDDVTSNAGNSLVANGVAATALASSDTIDHIDVLNMMEENAVDEFDRHIALIVHPRQHRDLTADTNFLTADKFGQQAGVFNGFVGKILGIPVYSTTQVDITTSTAFAILLSAPDAFSYIFKTPVGGAIRGRLAGEGYDVLGRFSTVGGTVDFDSVVTRANAICKLQSWCA